VGLDRSNSENNNSNQSENDDIPEKANCKLGLLQFYLNISYSFFE